MEEFWNYFGALESSGTLLGTLSPRACWCSVGRGTVSPGAYWCNVGHGTVPTRARRRGAGRGTVPAGARRRGVGREVTGGITLEAVRSLVTTGTSNDFVHAVMRVPQTHAVPDLVRQRLVAGAEPVVINDQATLGTGGIRIPGKSTDAEIAGLNVDDIHVELRGGRIRPGTFHGRLFRVRKLAIRFSPKLDRSKSFSSKG